MWLFSRKSDYSTGREIWLVNKNEWLCCYSAERTVVWLFSWKSGYVIISLEERVLGFSAGRVVMQQGNGLRKK